MLSCKGNASDQITGKVKIGKLYMWKKEIENLKCKKVGQNCMCENCVILYSVH